MPHAAGGCVRRRLRAAGRPRPRDDVRRSRPWWTMGAGAAATGTAGWFLAGRERGLGLIVMVVVAAQTVLHETFSLGQNLMPGSGTASSPTWAAAHGRLRTPWRPCPWTPWT
ncbi:hypothetical protein ACRAWF_36280 [Streptomyces sp. L7]